jgi:hypothetical protein
LAGDAVRSVLFVDTIFLPNVDLDTGIPSIHISPKDREVYVTSTTANTYVYSLNAKGWSPQAGFDGGIYLGAWSPITSRLYGLFVNQFDVGFLGSINNTLAQDSVPTSSGIDAYIQFRPLQAMFPGREISLEEIILFHNTTGSQSGCSLIVQVSLDGGVTFSKSHEITLPTAFSEGYMQRTPIVLRQLGQNLLLRIIHDGGAGGHGVFSLQAAEAIVRDVGPARNLSNPTTVGATL